jgi:predicted DCC family thiol-disulfide oxidoreductase YuxK
VSLPPSNILFYDGECGLCSRSVRFLITRDRKSLLYFAPIQGETAAQCLDAPLREVLSTAIYQRPNAEGQTETLLRSEAVLCALIDIRSHLRWLAYPARWIPLKWRDTAYNWVAHNRDRFFAKGACELPAPSERARYLP